MQEFKTQPRQHQLEALVESRDREAFALLMEMGTGKSKVAIDTAAHLWRTGQIDGIVILAPKGVYTNWTSMDELNPGELRKHMPDDVMEAAQILVWTGSTTKQYLRSLHDQIMAQGGLQILAMNIEALSASSRARAHYEKFLHKRRCLVIVDESTVIKNPSAKRTKFINKRAHLARFRRILTGQPAPRSPLDVYSQFEFLDPRILGHKSFWTFRQRYAVMQKSYFGGRSVDVVVGYRNVEELHGLIAPHSYRRTKKQCLDLPPQQYFFRDVELTDEQRTAYDQMRAHAMAGLGERIECVACHGRQTVEVDAGGGATQEVPCSVCGGAGHVYSGYASATAVITQILRLHQIVCGHITDEGGLVHALPSRRPQALLDQIEESGAEKTIVWANYTFNIRECIETLSAAYGPESVVHFYGATSPEERETAKVRFQTDERCLFWVGNPATGRFGNTLTASSNTVYYSNNHDLEHREQSEQRNHRIGSEIHESVNYTDLIARGTVEERIIKNLRAKINTASVITGDEFREWLI